MKKGMLLLLLISVVTFASDESPFTGTWCVEDEGVSLSFITDTTVRYASEDDETVSGEGNYSADSSTLTASINIDGSLMELVYSYTEVDDYIEIVTTSMSMDSMPMEVTDIVMKMVRCNKADEEQE